MILRRRENGEQAYSTVMGLSTFAEKDLENSNGTFEGGSAVKITLCPHMEART